MNMDFKHKTCFVTGGAQGMGKAVVTAFHHAGANVTFCDMDVKDENDLY